MRNIDLIRQVISASENNWPHVLGCLNINVPDSPRRHAPCPACGGKDRFRFDDNGRGSFICNQCGAGDGLDLIKRVNNCDTTEAALLAADVLGIDYRTTETPEATSQKREQLETERQRREQERLKRAEKDEQQRRDTFSRQFDDMRRKAVNGKSDYLVAKGVGDFTFPVLPDGSLLLALVDKSGAVTAAQTITSHGEKRLLTGSAKRGAYHAINAPETTQSILIAEGLATALSAHLIRPEALTVAAIDAGNLLYVAQVLRDKFPSAQIIIAADNDHSEGRQNTGRIAAEKAALSVSGWVALPPTDHKADWNDYHQKHGIKCATEAFNKSMYQPQGNGVKQEPQTIEGSDFKVMDTDPLKPRIESREDGIYWVSPRADSQSGEIINNESWLCSPLSVIGTGRDDKDQYYNQYAQMLKADPEGAAAFAAAAGINTNAKKLMSVRENDDGTVTKYYTDGSEEQGKLNQPISGDGFRPIALPTAQKIMEKSPEGAKKAAGFAYRVRDALDSIDTLKDQLSPQRVAIINNALGNGTLANLTLSPTEQQYVVNANDAIMAILRQETGAAIAPAEMSKYYQMYFPQPGDSTKTIDTKRRKMENQFNSLKAASGRAYDALRVISAVDRGTSSSSQTLPQSEQVSQPAASSNFSSLWGD